MNIVLVSGFSCLFFILGYNLNMIVTKIKNKKYSKKTNEVFKTILKKFNTGATRFKSRFANTVYISFNLENHGKVDLVYMIDKNDIAVFKANECLFTSIGVEYSIIQEIIKNINDIHGRELNDIVNIFGLILNRKEFENIVKVKIEDLKINYANNKELSGIDSIINNNKMFDIDDILDKISSIGLESLSQEEKTFLESYSRR